MNSKELREFIKKFGDAAKASEATAVADNKAIVKASYNFDMPNDADVSGEMAFIYVNDVEVARISFVDGDPKSKTVEVDITNQLMQGEYNIVKFETTVLNNLFGLDISSDAEFSFKYKGKRLVKEEYKTKLELRQISDSWAFFVQ